MIEMSQSIKVVTQSLFVPHHIRVQPVPSVPSSNTRLMAGYLLLLMPEDGAGR